MNLTTTSLPSKKLFTCCIWAGVKFMLYLLFAYLARLIAYHDYIIKWFPKVVNPFLHLFATIFTFLVFLSYFLSFSLPLTNLLSSSSSVLGEARGETFLGTRTNHGLYSNPKKFLKFFKKRSINHFLLTTTPHTL